MLEFLLAALAFATLLAIVIPLLRPTAAPLGSPGFNRAVYRDQLHELDRDAARGLITEAEAAAAQLEVQRRLLATDSQTERATSTARSPILALILTVTVAVSSIALYLTLGSPGVPDVPFASRTQGKNNDLAAILAQLTDRLRAEPANPGLWVLYGRANTSSGDWERAADAYRRAIALGATDPDIRANLGEMLVAQAQGAVTPEALAVFQSVVSEEPGNTMARFYLAVAAGQAGDARKAIDLFQSVLADLPEDAPPRQEVVRRLAEAAKAAGMQPPAPAPGPDADTMAAAANMPEADRKAMIEGMVTRLADRLKAEPEDADGWLRLARARTVLGQRNEAADAFEAAALLRNGDVRIKLQAVDALLAGLSPAAEFPPRAITLLRDVEAAAPDEPAALWYLGILAARDRQPDKARALWTRLLPKLPPGSGEDKLVRAAIEALAGK